MNDLQIIEQIQAPVLSLNFDEMEEQAKQIADAYTSVAITDDTYMSAKNDAKKLAGYVNDIEKKRKEIKRQAEAPIKEFDARCKQIEQILIDAKTAIEGVTVKYDDDRKKERADKIKAYLDKQLAKSGLRPEYVAKIVEPANAQNLSATLKSIKEDYDNQITALMQQQSNYDQLMVAAQAIIDTVNDTISQKLSIDTFAADIERVMGQDVPFVQMNDEISGIIRDKAASIKEAEDRIRQEAIETERLRQAEAEKASDNDVEVQAPVTEESPVVEEVSPFSTPAAPAEVSPFAPKSEEVSPFAPKAGEVNPFGPKEPRWEGTIKLSGDASNLNVVLDTLQAVCAQQNVSFTLLDTAQI